MRISHTVLIMMVAAVPAASAQNTAPPSAAASAITCASPAGTDIPSNPLRLVGLQDSMPRMVFGSGDMLVLSGGTAKGVQIGQQYFVRRPVYSNASHHDVTGILTAAAIRVVSTNETAALATVDRFCGAMYRDDYLVLNPDAPPPAPTGPGVNDLDFSSMGKVLSAAEYHITAGKGDLLTIDRGSEQGVAPGWRFAIYRDLKISGLPLASVGEGVVLSAGAGSSLAQITKSGNAVVAGDYVVPRK